MLDSKTAFMRKIKNLNDLNLIQLFMQRYGIGYNISSLICNYIGYHPNYKFSDVKNTYLTDKVRTFFILHLRYFDAFLKRIMARDLKLLIKLKTYKGLRYVYRLPIRGQRTRTNGNTTKHVRFTY